MGQLNYKAFISYKHSDTEQGKAFVQRLESALKRYAKPLLSPPIKLFRDEVSMMPGADLPGLIRAGLEQSEFLVLLASPEAAASPWVKDELNIWFEELGRSEDTLIIVLLEGQINLNRQKLINWRRSPSLPSSLKAYLTKLPLWVNFSALRSIDDYALENPGFKVGINGIVARFRGREPEDMLGEEVAQHRKTRRLAWSVGMVLLVLTVTSALFGTLSEVRRKEAVRLQEQSLARQLAAQATLLRRQQADLIERSSLLAVESLKREPTLAGVQVLQDNLSLLRKKTFELRHFAPVLDLAFDVDGSHLATVTAAAGKGGLRLAPIDPRGQVLHRDHGAGLSRVAFNPRAKLLAVGGWQHAVTVYDADTATQRYQLPLTERAEALAFSPEGKLLAVGVGQSVLLYKTPDGKVVARLEHDGRVEDLSFSQKAGLLIVATGANEAVVWRLKDASKVARLGHSNSVNAVALSPDGKMAASGGLDRTVKLWDLAQKDSLRTWPHQSEVTAVSFSSDGRWLASASGDAYESAGEVRVWSVDDLAEAASMNHGGPVTSIKFSPDDRTIASSSLDNTARIWDVHTGVELARLTHDEPVMAVAFDLKGNRLATGGHDHLAKVWQISNPAMPRLSHATNVTAIAVSPDGRFVVTGSEGLANDQFPGLLRFWDVKTGRLLSGSRHTASISSVAFSSNGQLVAAASSSSDLVRVWRTGTREVTSDLQHSSSVNDFQFRPGTELLVTGSDDKMARIWQAGTGAEIRRIEHDNAVESVAISPDGHWLATAAGSASAFIWNAVSGVSAARLAHPAEVIRVVFNQDGKLLATTAKDGRVRIWEAGAWQLKFELEHPEPVEELHFGPDGRWLFTRMASNNEAIIWNLKTQKRVASLSHEFPVEAIDMSPDGRWLATGAWDNTVRIWETSSGLELTRRVFGHIVSDVAFGESGRRIAVASWDKSARTWLWQSDDLISAVCERLSQNLSAAEWHQFVPNIEYKKTCENLQ